MQLTLPKHVRPLLLAALVGAMVLAVAGCGGSSSASASSSAAGAPRGGASAFAAYASCLRKHGVDLPSFGGGGSGGSPPSSPPSGSPPSGSPPRNGGSFGGNLTPAQRKAFQVAQSACASLRLSFGGGGSAPNP